MFVDTRPKFVRCDATELQGFVFKNMIFTAVEPGSDQHFVLGPGKRPIVFEDLVEVAVVADGPIVLENALIVEAKDIFQFEPFGDRAVVVFLFQRLHRELGVQILTKSVQEQFVGRDAGCDAA